MYPVHNTISGNYTLIDVTVCRKSHRDLFKDVFIGTIGSVCRKSLRDLSKDVFVFIVSIGNVRRNSHRDLSNDVFIGMIGSFCRNSHRDLSKHVFIISIGFRTKKVFTGRLNPKYVANTHTQV